MQAKINGFIFWNHLGPQVGLVHIPQLGTYVGGLLLSWVLSDSPLGPCIGLTGLGLLESVVGQSSCKAKTSGIIQFH